LPAKEIGFYQEHDESATICVIVVADV